MTHYPVTSSLIDTRRSTSTSRRHFPIATGWNVPSTKPSKAHSVKACAFLLGYLAAYLAAGYGAITLVERVWLALVP
jgi:hypothetical protein